MRIENFPFESEKPTAVALGFFDGVHTAHRELIEGVTKLRTQGLTPAVFTFKNLPKKAPTGELTTQREKETILEGLGIELLTEADFEAVKNLSPEDFVREVLKEKLNAKSVFCGYNYRFGKNAAGDADTLRTLCEKEGIEVKVLKKISLKGTDVSSTQIKSFLEKGMLREANALLGRSYSFEGEIVHGRKLGRKLGTPTLNIRLEERKFLPRFGVYCAKVFIEGREYPAVLNLGKKPTVKGDKEVTLEAYLLSAQGDFYESFAKVTLTDYLRDEEKFSSLEALKEAIKKDVAKAKRILDA